MLVLMLSLLLTQAGEPAAPSQGRMFPVGQVSPEDVDLKSGTTVLALCGKELKEVPLTVKDSPASTDEETGIYFPATKDLSVPCAADLLFYNVPELKPGAVQPSFEVKRENTSRGRLSDGTPLSFSVKGKDYKVLQEFGESPAFRVFLSDGKKKHLLYELQKSEGREGDATLLWAGDMNQDGHPDVILMAGGESRQISLFLSGKGSKGPRKVATYEYSGLD